MKNLIIFLLVLALIGAGGYYFLTKDIVDTTKPATSTEVATTTEPATSTNDKETIIGKSVEDRDIIAYHYGSGDKEILFVGGIHGGYSWNTPLVAFELMDYLETKSENIPDGVKVTVIPVLNPDGLFKTVGSADRFTASDVPTAEAETIAGRFNANKVDLNRNFDCDWQKTGTWKSQTVSGGDKAFSEPESIAIKNYVESHKLSAVVVWYSSAGGVFASSCHNGVSSETKELTSIYSKASGYKAYNDFDFYDITGDMVNWLAKNNIPAISVLLSNHSDTEWNKNRAGIEAILNYYAE